MLQWQCLEKDQISDIFSTKGVLSDGSLKTNYPPSFFLVPIGHWNWKWNEARSKYHIWELEMLSGVLALAANYRLVAGLPLVWLTDNDALTKFLDHEPPINKRQRRWYVYLSQFPIVIFHLPGAKNELTDFLSRDLAEKVIGCPFDQLAQGAFARMDAQLDLCLEPLLTITHLVPLTAGDFENDPDFGEVWSDLEPFVSKTLNGWLYYRTDIRLFRETKLCIPSARLDEVILKVHTAHNHPGVNRTHLCFLKNYACAFSQSELILRCKKLVDSCSICLLGKPNRSCDRGEIGSIPVPMLANDTLFLDFISMDECNGFDYILTVVDGLTHFSQFFPCQKNLTGEGVIKLLLDRWISVYGKPQAIHSDNDVRWKNDRGFFQTVMRAMGVQVHLSIPRQPRTNGVCENVNRQFLQNMRCLMQTCKLQNWTPCVSYCTWLMNSQVSPLTQLTPHEMFLGRPSAPPT